MRLICPNCGAQYEVTEDVIPAEGRDVQCSNCGHTWFEGHGASEAAEADKGSQMPQPATQEAEKTEAPVEAEPEPTAAADESDVRHEPEPDAEPEPMPESEVAAQEDPAPKPETPAAAPRDFGGSIKEAFGDIKPPENDEISATVTADLDEDEPPLVTTPPRRAVDASISQILREEAERETTARRRDSENSLETQGDLGLTEAPKKPNNLVKAISAAEADAVDRENRTKSTTTAAVAATVAAASRKELLPDIEEINSSLRSSAERGEVTIPDPEDLVESERRGFRFGFFSVLMLIVVLTLIYVFAPLIAERVPALAALLQGYVDQVDAGRLWLDLKMQVLLEMMRPAE